MQQFNNNNKLAINNLGKGPKRKKSDKKISIFLDTRPLFENFLKKMIFSPLKSQKHLEKFSKKEKN